MARTSDHIGTRIRYWRRRRGGMSQETLAGLAGLSRPYISQIEGGQRAVDRRSTLIAIARALQVSVADLLDQPGDPTDPVRAAAAAAIPTIRVALVEVSEGDLDQPRRNAAEVSAAVDELVELRRRSSDYASIAALLPDLLRDAAAHGRTMQARAAFEASICLRNLGHGDLALPAARLALDGALDSEDPAWIGSTRHIYILARPAEAAASAHQLAAQAIADLQAAAADPRVRQTLGMVHLSAALTSAVDGRADDATAHLAAAADEARTLGDPPDGVGFSAFAFGPTNVALWRMTVAAEQGEYPRVLELARRTHPGTIRIADRHYSYWLNMGRALAESGKTDAEARAAFLQAELAAPVPFGVNPLARDTVQTMVNRAHRSAIPQDLRSLATRLGIPVNA